MTFKISGLRHWRMVCAIGVTLWPAVASVGQTSAPPVLSEAVRNHVKAERLDIVTSIRGLPLGVRDELQTLFGSSTLDIAEPGAEFQGTKAGANSYAPARRLIAAGCSIDHCLVYYERAGRPNTWIVALFRWTPAATSLEWSGNARGGMGTIDNVKNAVLSGAFKGPVKVW
jgi:hypothetical protein